MKRTITLAVALLVLLPVLSQEALVSRQRKFPKTIPAGNYSGIAPLGNDRYAVVCDKSPDGFFVFHIVVDTLTGRIISADNEGFRASGMPNRDQEGIAVGPPLLPPWGDESLPQGGGQEEASPHVFISGEADNEIHEYAADGTLLATYPVSFIPIVGNASERSVANEPSPFPNRGLESLTYDTSTHTFFTTTETPMRGDSVLRILQLDSLLRPCRHYVYQLDPPKHRKKRKNVVVNGVSELCALGDGRLIVMEREIHVPPLKIGASVRVRLYITTPTAPLLSPLGGMTYPDPLSSGSNISLSSLLSPLSSSSPKGEVRRGLLQKTLLCEFTTRLNILSRKFANYEGLCVAARRADGSIVLLLLADSQNRFRGFLRDWMRTVIIPKQDFSAFL